MLLRNEHGIVEHPRQQWLGERATSLWYPYNANSVWGTIFFSYFIYPLCVIGTLSLLLRTSVKAEEHMR